MNAVFMRGGTSKGLFFHRADLPCDPAQLDALLVAAMGSPDPYARQLDGMGGGLSSLSKVVVVEPSSHLGIDVEYTFGQVSIDAATVHYQGNCGNLTAAVPVFAIDEGLVRPPDGIATIRMLNLNTRKVVQARLAITNGLASVEGEFAIDGVTGRGPCIELDFLDPAGSVTGTLFPAGAATTALEVAKIGSVPVSIVDAGGLVVFVRAESLGLSGSEDPHRLSCDAPLLAKIEALRAAGAIRIGMARSIEEVKVLCQAYPAIMMVSPTPLAGSARDCSCPHVQTDITVRAFSMGTPHRVIPMADALCLAVAAKIDGTLVHDIVGTKGSGNAIVIGHPSGSCCVKADVRRCNGWRVVSATAFRTARRLMSGQVHVLESKVATLASSCRTRTL